MGKATILYSDECTCDMCNQEKLCAHIENIRGDVMVYCKSCLSKMIKEIEERQYQDYLSLPDT